MHEQAIAMACSFVFVEMFSVAVAAFRAPRTEEPFAVRAASCETRNVNDLPTQRRGANSCKRQCA
ncbi:hypothetical protein AN191_07680 [Loktanella sp. 5RATIMAR09]|nr:hypothetical protein AN191_07680 [Loktanella sp. 5RATIMAR09]